MKQEIEYEHWFSTYGLIIAERILETHQIRLRPDDLIRVIKNGQSFQNGMVVIPSLNLFNGIIRDQAREYQNYVQKKLIDYLLSGQANEDKTGPGEGLRQQLEAIRQEMLELGEAFDELDRQHRQAITESQAALREISVEWLKRLKALEKNAVSLCENNHIALNPEQLSALRSTLQLKMGVLQQVDISVRAPFIELSLEQAIAAELNRLSVNTDDIFKQLKQITPIHAAVARDNTQRFIHFRAQFKQKVIAVKELLSQLHALGYKEDNDNDQENRQVLDFYQQLGEE